MGQVVGALAQGRFCVLLHRAGFLEDRLVDPITGGVASTPRNTLNLYDNTQD